MPAEAVLVEPGPEEADAEGTGGKDRGEDAAAHGSASRVVVGEGAQTDASVSHAGRRFREGEKQNLIQQHEHREGCCSRESSSLEGEVAGGGCAYRAVKFADGEGKDGGEGEKSGGNDAAVDNRRHETQAEGCGLWREYGLERSFRDLDYGGDGVRGKEDGRPLGCGRFDGRSG